MVNPLKFYKNANYHLDRVRRCYVNYIKLMNIPQNAQLSVLDIGIGSGKVFNDVLYPLLPKNVSEIVASDLEKDMVDYCRSNFKDPRITFEVLDIAADNIPNHLQKRFDLVFSSYCFSYLKDLRKGFSNSGKCLKPNGELLNVFQYKKNGLYQTYRRMSRMNKWKSYTEDYANYKTNLTGSNPEEELKQIFQDIGMTLLRYEFDPDNNMGMPKRHILESYKSLDSKFSLIPKHEQEDYMNDFIKIFGEETGIDFTDESTHDEVVQLNFPTCIVHARN